MKLIKSIATAVKSIFIPSQWSKVYVGSGYGNGNVNFLDSIWLSQGVEDKAQTVASLPIKFLNVEGLELGLMTNEQRAWAYVLNNPDNALLGCQLWELTVMLYDTDGIAYWVLFDDYGNPIANPLQIPSRILCFGKRSINPIFDTTDVTRVLGWMLTDGGVTKRLRNFQIVRFWKTNTLSYKYGLSMMDKIGLTMSLDKSAKKTNSNYFKNGARPSGMLKQVERMNEDQAKEFASDFRDKYSSPENSGKIPLIPREFDFKEADGIKDMDFVNLHKSNRDEFFATTRTPKHHLGVNDDLNYATAEITEKVYYLSVIQPMVTVFEQTVNSRLLLGSGMKISFSFDNIPSVQIDRLRVKEQENKNTRELMRIATYLWKLGYPQNWINEYLNLDLPMITESWAKNPHDPIISEQNVSPQVEDSTSEKKIFFDLSPIAKCIKKNKSIIDFVEEGNEDEMDLFCRSVESSSIGEVIPKFEKAMKSYFDRLEKSQIKKIEAFVEGSSYENKSTGEREIKKENVENVLFSRQKWDAILLQDTQSFYVSAYLSSLSVVEKELNGFDVFSFTDNQVVETAKALQINVVGINDRLRNNIRTSIVNSLENGGSLGDLVNAVRSQFKASQARVTTIARTECGIAMNGARFDAISEEVEKKLWVSSKDSFVRASHKDYSKLGSQPMNYEYSDGLRYPQDSECGDAEEVVNCRCTLVAGRGGKK